LITIHKHFSDAKSTAKAKCNTSESSGKRNNVYI